MHLSRSPSGSAVIGCGYGAPQPIAALPEVTLYSLLPNDSITSKIPVDFIYLNMYPTGGYTYESLKISVFPSKIVIEFL